MDNLHINSEGEILRGDNLLTAAEISNLPVDQAVLVRDWEALHADYATNLFRFYGTMDENGQRTLDLEMEFIFPTNNGDVATRLTELCKSLGATWEPMNEWTDKEHGPETQVAFNLNVFGQDHESVGKVVAHWREETVKRGLDQYWVSLI